MGPFAKTVKAGGTSLLSAGLFAIVCSPANAACLAGCSQNGLTFSEASKSFKITHVTGSGTTANPFVVHQDVWGLDISLAISGLKQAPQHSIFNRPGFAIRIVSRNLTGAFWRFYDHELQETIGYASSENDGLSFAQGIGRVHPYTSDRYTHADEITDVRDFINFHRGTGVSPGEHVQFDYFVTDTIPNSHFYIRQRPDYRPNAPATPTIQQRPVAPTPPAPAVKSASTPTTAKSAGSKQISGTPAAQGTSHPVLPLPAVHIPPIRPQPVPEPTPVGMMAVLWGSAMGRWLATKGRTFDQGIDADLGD